MNSETKGFTIFGIAALAAVVACFAIMADCSKAVALHSAETYECGLNGGEWIETNSYSGTGFCRLPKEA